VREFSKLNKALSSSKFTAWRRKETGRAAHRYDRKVRPLTCIRQSEEHGPNFHGQIAIQFRNIADYRGRSAVAGNLDPGGLPARRVQRDSRNQSRPAMEIPAGRVARVVAKRTRRHGK
jgi:hypothetical protein